MVLRTLTWVDLFDLGESEARKQILRAVGHEVMERLAEFPGPKSQTVFPGAIHATAKVGQPIVTVTPPPSS